MPITYEAPAPIGLAESIYDQTARREAALRNQQMAAQLAQSRGSYGGGGGGGSDIQDAINHRDDSQARNQAQNDSLNVVSAGQVFGAQAQAAHQQQSYNLQAQLQQTELSQSENMRLQRLNNSVGEINNDPSLSDSEKSEMIYQVKGIQGPLQHRQAMAKMAADTQAKEQQAEQFKLHAAAEKQRMDITGKSAEDRQSFTPDVQQLAAITQHLNETLPQYPAMMGGDQVRQAHITQMARQEAMRQGLGTTWQMEPDGKMHAIKGPGSKDHEQMLKGEGQGDRGQMTMDQYLKMHQHATQIVDKYANETKEGDIPGTKVPAHPELGDRDKRREEVEKELRKMGAPANVDEFNKQAKTKPVWGYDKTKAPWAKPGTNAPDAQAPEPTQKPFEWAKPETPEQKATVANFQSLDQKLKDAKAPADMRQNAIADWGQAKLLLQKKGSVANMDADEKRQFLAAMDTIAKTIKHDPAEEAAKQRAANPPPPEEKAWWQGGGEYGTPGKAAGKGYRYLRDAIQGSNPFLR